MAARPAPIWMDHVDPNPNLQPGQMDMDGWMDGWIKMGMDFHVTISSLCRIVTVLAPGVLLIGEIGTY